MRPLAVVVSTVLASLFAAPDAAARQRGTVGAAAFVSPWQPGNVEGSPSLSYENESPDSLVVGIAADAGVTLGPRLQLAVEIGWPARGDLAQTHFYFNPFRKEVRLRESTVFGVARVALAPGTVVGADLVTGAGLVRQSALERVAEGRFGSSGYTFGAFGPEQEVTRWTWGAVAGLDVPIRVSPRVSLVPHARVIYTDRGDIAEVVTFPTYGVPDITVRVGLGLRVGF